MSIGADSEYSKRVIAQRELVITTSHDRAQAVLISADDYRRPRPYRIEDLLDEDWQAIEREQQALAAREAASGT